MPFLPPPALEPLADFRSAAPEIAEQSHVRLQATSQGLHVTFPAGKVGRVIFRSPRPEAGGVALRFTNLSSFGSWSPMVLGQQGKPGFIEAGGWISPGTHTWLVFGGLAQPNRRGLGYNPPVEGALNMAASYQDHDRLDLYGFQISHPPQDLVLRLEKSFTVPVPQYRGLVDRWGQSALRTWRGKITSDEQLREEAAREEERIRREGPPLATDEFGGWLEGPLLEASGRFRVALYKGKWAFVTPTGRLFLSFGQNNITLDEATIVQGREEMFQWLPGEGDPLSSAYGQAGLVLAGPGQTGWRTYDFAQANAMRQFGEGWKERFYALTEGRMSHWGFNTLANWTDEELQKRRRIPYVATTAVWGPSRRLAGAPDPFDPVFEETLREDVLRKAPWVKNDPWCLGIFVDNEINWGSGASGPGRIFYLRAALEADADVWAKRRLVRFLEDQHGSPSALNLAWGTDFASFEEILSRRTTLSEAQLARERVMADGIAFSRMVYRQYFRTVRRVLNELLPGTLYLGPRFHAWTPDAADIAAEYCDVVSFNVYSPDVGPGWLPAPGWKAPTLIGEFGFRGRDTGFFNRTGTDALTQKGRAEKLAAFWNSAFSRDWMVGVHWFRYRDQSVLGRALDGENANFGFVAITNTVYPELVEEARRLVRRVYRDRWGP